MRNIFNWKIGGMKLLVLFGSLFLMALLRFRTTERRGCWC